MSQSEILPLMAEGRFELLVQSVTDYAIYMLDPNGVVVSWNPGAQRFKGYTANEIIGHHFSLFYTEEDRQAGIPATALRTARETGRFEAEGWRVRKDGTQFWANVVIDAVRDPSGALLGFAKVTRDLTERLANQRALEQAREVLFQSQKMDALGKLTGGVAHDFNNLLAVVIGSLDLARRRLAEGGNVSRLIDNAILAAERGATLTQRMLAFARKQELKIEPVDVTMLVRGMTELFERSLGPGITIETRFPLVLPSIQADIGQLELALLNLTVNARDAMPDGGTIVIGARQEKVEVQNPAGLAVGDYICLFVKDDGGGMDEHVLARAMEPFFTTKGIGKGTGLGLSMVHGLAEQCGGKLQLKSSRGKGTTAEIWLSAYQAPAIAAGPPKPAPLPSIATPLVILAVDDDDLVLTNTAAMLEELGHEVLQASSGKQALQILAHKEVDLVLTDYAMPEVTGAQLADAIQAGWPGVPIVMVSGYAELPPGLAADLPRLSKPFREDQLALSISVAIAQCANPKGSSATSRGGGVSRLRTSSRAG